MKNLDYDVIVVGGGPAGMAAALRAVEEGVKTLLVERENLLGGILKQCIHSGFGLHYFGKEYTGPEYAYEFIKKISAAKKSGLLTILKKTFVIKIESGVVTIKNTSGEKELFAKSVVLAAGCRERTAGAIKLCGERTSGVWTAGQVQKWVNMYGLVPCKNPIILGSGDIGLIMARRLTMEGSQPQMVLEVQSSSGGLARNIKQCLDDYNIPLYLNTTVVEVLGYPKITGVIIAKVDENFKPIEETKRKIDCDGLILSVGLLPETDLIMKATKNPKTNSVLVNEYRETSIPGVFACGNVLHVHDLVDYVTKESIFVGKMAAKNAKNELKKEDEHLISPGDGVRYVIPNSFFEGSGNLELLFRVTKRFKKAELELVDESGNVKFKKFILSASVGEMQSVSLDKSSLNTSLTLKMVEKE